MRKTKTATKGRSKSKKRGSSKRDGIRFEPLETRQLMATVNVADFGARINDNADDTAAVMAAIRASQPGDTILFSGGVFNFSDYLTVASDRTYKGANGAILRGRGKGNQAQLIKVQGNNVTVTGLTFEGGGLFFERHGGRNTNIVVDGNVFRLNTSGEQNAGITMTSGLNDSRITNNYFTGYNVSFGIYGYNYKNLVIANNEFVNVRAGMHIDAFGDSGNLLVEQNYMLGLMGMGMEFQGTASNLKFYDNWYGHPNLSTNRATNDTSFAYSLILDKSSNIEIKRNTCIAPERPDGVGCRIAFEVGGENTVVEENYVNGVNHVIASNDGVGGSSILVKNNRWLDIRQGPGGIRYNAMTFAGVNGANAPLSWNINRPTPGIGAKRYGSTGGGTTPTPTPNPTPEPAPSEVAPVAPGSLSAVATGPTAAKLFWVDRSYNETGFKIERSTDGKTWTQIATVGAGVTSYTVTGLTAGQTYSFRARATNSVGDSGYSGTVSVTPVALGVDGTVFISDVSWTSTKNGWGPAERDMSNGETAAGDGTQIRMNGKSYAKGVGVHAGSEIKIKLDGKYTSFVSDIGLDDETEGGGSVIFEVWADGTRLYSSGKLGANAVRTVNVNVTGKQELTLVVVNAGDNSDYDHANWADARLLKTGRPSTRPPVEPETPIESLSQVYLSDMKWTSATSGWGVPEVNKSNGETAAADGSAMKIGGKSYLRGLGVHSRSEIHYQLDGKYGVFSADIGLDDEVGNRGSVVFEVWADGVKLFQSGKLTGADAAQRINVNVQGRQELWLIVNEAGDGKDFDHANWADARLTVMPRPTLGRSQYLSDLKTVSQTNGWGAVELNTSVGDKELGDGTIMRLNGQTYTRGLGVHSQSRLVYALGGAYTTFITDLGIDDEVGNSGSVIFQIWSDGKKVYDSGTMTGRSASKTAMIDVSGVKELWLVVDDAGDGTEFDHADWANARLVAA